MFGRIINGIPEIGLPETGMLSGGCTVSNYNQLPCDKLASEGWLEIAEINAEYDPNTQTRTVDTVMLGEGQYAGKIVITYKVEDIPVDDTPSLEDLQAQLQSTKETNDALSGAVMDIFEKLMLIAPEQFGV